jgi:glycosyltransferase involved in cell wall biosynthesis
MLILTQKVDKNDDILGFFHGWLLEFAKHYEKIIVICLQKGEYDLPSNVKVFSLGKEKENLKIENWYLKIATRFKYTLRFLKYIWVERKEYDRVFCHMNPIYVVLGGLFWRFKGKKVALWYTHKSVDLKLRIAEKLANIIFTASKESFQLKSKKVEVVGHGIDVNKFICNENIDKKNDFFEITTIGRISPIKNHLLMLKVFNFLVKNNIKNFVFNIVGSPITDLDKRYQNKLEKYVIENNLSSFVKFSGSISHNKILPFYQKVDIFINLSDTGSVDKAVLEAMACGCYILTSNKAFKSILPEDFLVKNDFNILVNKLIKVINIDKNDLKLKSKDLREIVVKNNSLSELIKKIRGRL